MRLERFPMKWIIAAALLVIAAVIMAGCGGGGGGGGSSSTTSGTSAGGVTSGGTGSNTTGTFAGTITLVNNEGPGIGYTVTFDGNSAYSATSDINGAFTLRVPSSAITGNDTLYIIQPNGTIAYVYSLPAGSTGITGLQISTGPPAPPASQTQHVVKSAGA